FAQHGIKQVIGIQLLPILNGGNRIDTRLWSSNVRKNDSAIERDDRRVIEFDQAIVKREDLPPVRAFIIIRRAVAGSDSRLKMIRGDLLPSSRLREMEHASRDHRSIPSCPVLLLEPKQVSLRIHSRRDARGV